jgi:dihydropteroate synthase
MSCADRLFAQTFLGQLLGIVVEEWARPSALVSAFAEENGAGIVQVHQVGPTEQAIRLLQAMRGIIMTHYKHDNSARYT